MNQPTSRTKTNSVGFYSRVEYDYEVDYNCDDKIKVVNDRPSYVNNKTRKEISL